VGHGDLIQKHDDVLAWKEVFQISEP
jgi:hypothetical protein